MGKIAGPLSVTQYAALIIFGDPKVLEWAKCEPDEEDAAWFDLTSIAAQIDEDDQNERDDVMLKMLNSSSLSPSSKSPRHSSNKALEIILQEAADEVIRITGIPAQVSYEGNDLPTLRRNVHQEELGALKQEIGGYKQEIAGLTFFVESSEGDHPGWHLGCKNPGLFFGQLDIEYGEGDGAIPDKGASLVRGFHSIKVHKTKANTFDRWIDKNAGKRATLSQLNDWLKHKNLNEWKGVPPSEKDTLELFIQETDLMAPRDNFFVPAFKKMFPDLQRGKRKTRSQLS